MPVVPALFFGVALAYLALPGHPLSLLPGVPLGVLPVAMALALGAWAIGLRGLPPRAGWGFALIAALGAAKLVLWSLAPSYGLLAEYRAGGPGASVERSTEWRRLDGTRVDSGLVFRGAEFPVHFFNDIRRFNYYTANEPRRDLLPFSVRWSGWLWVPEPAVYHLELEANGRATLALDGLTAADAATLAVESGQRVRVVTASAQLDAGLHPIEVTYARPEEGMPWLVVSSAAGRELPRPLAAPRLVYSTAAADRLRWEPVLRPIAIAVDASYLAALALLLVAHATARVGEVRAAMAGARARLADELERPLLALFALTMLLAALAAHLHLVGQTVLLSGGNDWLAYGGYARDVLLEGPLLAEGRAPGQGQPFYYQPLYIYWLALVHLVLGEGLFGPLFANVALGVVANLLVYLLARELFGRSAAVAALLLFAAYLGTAFAPTAGLLLSENLLIPLVPLLLLLLTRAARTGRWRPLIGAAVVLGLAGLTRTTPLALLPPALLILLLAYRRLGLDRRAALLRLAVFVGVCAVTIAPTTARNLAVSGRPVLITSSAGANLWEAHRPSSRVDLSRIDRHPLYERLSLDRYTREVLEFIRQDPAGYVATLVPMALYAVGVVGAPAGTNEIHPGLLGMFLAYLVVVAASPAARRLPTWFVHAFVWTHLAQMTVFFSHQYGFRLILPMYVALAPIAGHGIAMIATAVTRRWHAARPAAASRLAARPLPRTLGTGLVLVAAAGAIVASGAAAPEDQRAREAFYGLYGDAAIAARQALRPDRLRLADAVYFVGDDSRSSEVAYLRGLAFPTMRWFDGARGMVFPPHGERGLYVLPDHAAPELARRCLGDRSLVEREQDAATLAWLDVAVSALAEAECGPLQGSVGPTFEGVARLVGHETARSLEPGQPLDALIRWEALARPTNRARPFVRLVDGKGRRWGQAEATAYPSSSWRAGEVALATARLEVDPTLPPGEYGLEFGFTLGSGFARVAEDGPWGQRGQDESRGGTLTLVSRSAPIAPELLPITVARSEAFGSVRLLGASLDRETPRAGDRLRLGLFWQNQAGRLSEQEVSIVVREPAGRVVHEWRGAPVDGTYPTTAWKPAEIVRDTWDLVLPATLSTGALELAVGMAPAGQQPEHYASIATLAVQAVQRSFAEPSPRFRQEARLGDLVQLVGYELRNRRSKPGDNLDVTLVWQALAETAQTYAISVRLVAADDRILAEHAAEPAAGRRPTTGWLPGEYVEDVHRLRIPRDTPRGRYPVEVLVYQYDDERRLVDPSGADRITLGTEVTVE